MVLAAASLDDIISICGFGVSFNLAFSQIDDDSERSSVLLLALNAPISIASGFGIGFFTAFCQHTLTKHALVRMRDGSAVRRLLLSAHFRGALLLVVSVAVVFLLDYAGFSAGGYLAVMVQACTLATLWNSLNADYQIHQKKKKKKTTTTTLPPSSPSSVFDVSSGAVSGLYKTLWFYVQPALFMLIGAEVLFRNISAISIQTAATILAVATSIRIAATYLSVSTSPVLGTKERLFVCLAWLPKATVQAALGSLVLDAARDMDMDDDGVTKDAIVIGETILTLAVLAILVTAPLGAVGIFITGPRWLEQQQQGVDNGDVYGNGAEPSSGGTDEKKEGHVQLKDLGPSEKDKRMDGGHASRI
jgi:NhaP-type Na+/H+ or K+/H+ antiporter